MQMFEVGHRARQNPRTCSVHCCIVLWGCSGATNCDQSRKSQRMDFSVARFCQCDQYRNPKSLRKVMLVLASDLQRWNNVTVPISTTSCSASHARVSARARNRRSSRRGAFEQHADCWMNLKRPSVASVEEKSRVPS